MDLEQIAADAKPTGGDTSQVLKLAGDMLDLMVDIVQTEELLKHKAAKLKTLTTETLPEAMDAIGMKEFALTNGKKIEIKPLIKASLPSQGAIAKAKDDEKHIMQHRLSQGLKFMRDNNAGSLIKNLLTFDLDKGKDNVVAELMKMGDELGIEYEREETVHAQTLNSWVKERIEEGKPVPQDTFAIFNGRQAIVAKSK